MMKTCFKCNKEKPLKEFYRHKKMADGHLNKCKACTKRDVSANYRDNIDHYKEYERGRAMQKHRVELRNRYQATDAGKASIRASKLKWDRRNPIKRAASLMVNNAVRDGRLQKSERCEDCGNAPNRLHGHHDDYAHPLVVRWLCPGCHVKWHRKNGEGANAT